MTQDEIIEMAQECKLIGMRPHLDGIYSEALIAFANLVATKEREACAKVCETHGVYPELNVWNGGPDWYKHGKDCATAIRAKGKQA